MNESECTNFGSTPNSVNCVRGGTVTSVHRYYLWIEGEED